MPAKAPVQIRAEGKQRSRCNAVRHGLTAETVIGALEDAEDYKAFEAAIIADYDAQSAVERELVLRLASLLWRLRRATTMETGLFEIQAGQLQAFKKTHQAQQASRQVLYTLLGQPAPGAFQFDPQSHLPDPDFGKARRTPRHRDHAMLPASRQPAQFRARSPQSLRSHPLAPGCAGAVRARCVGAAEATGTQMKRR